MQMKEKGKNRPVDAANSQRAQGKSKTWKFLWDEHRKADPADLGVPGTIHE